MSWAVDLNADVGEECGDDEALLSIVTTASVAAGGHAGGGAVLAETVRRAAAAAVAVGAHPSYPDRAGFGRISRSDVHDAAGIAAFVRAQVLAVSAACAAESIPLAHVKGHGALYNDAVTDVLVADAFLAGVEQAAADLEAGSIPVLGIPGSVLQRACDRRDLPFVAEAFADRAYLADGTLVPRRLEGAVLQDVEAVVRQALLIACDGVVEAVDGTLVPMPAATICVHGDTPGAVAMARRVRRELEDRGLRIAPTGRSG